MVRRSELAVQFNAITPGTRTTAASRRRRWFARFRRTMIAATCLPSLGPKRHPASLRPGPDRKAPLPRRPAARKGPVRVRSDSALAPAGEAVSDGTGRRVAVGRVGADARRRGAGAGAAEDFARDRRAGGGGTQAPADRRPVGGGVYTHRIAASQRGGRGFISRSAGHESDEIGTQPPAPWPPLSRPRLLIFVRSVLRAIPSRSLACT
jgi:hypothetical protein